MTSKNKNKGLIFIIISSVAFLPNLAGLLVAIFFLDPAPLVLYIVPGIMIVACIIGFIYGVSLRNKLKGN
jgi:hypothetical protein